MDFPRTWSVFLATGCWVGKVPWAPGTFGTLWGIPLAFALSGLPWPGALACIAGFSLAAVWIAGRAEAQMGREDPGSIVIDEVAGYLVTMFAVPFSLESAVAGFVFFRVMDIAKPPPVRTIDRGLSGGKGIVADDLAAGVYANILLRVFLHFF